MVRQIYSCNAHISTWHLTTASCSEPEQGSLLPEWTFHAPHGRAYHDTEINLTSEPNCGTKGLPSAFRDSKFKPASDRQLQSMLLPPPLPPLGQSANPPHLGQPLSGRADRWTRSSNENKRLNSFFCASHYSESDQGCEVEVMQPLLPCCCLG